MWYGLNVVLNLFCTVWHIHISVVGLAVELFRISFYILLKLINTGRLTYSKFNNFKNTTMNQDDNKRGRYKQYEYYKNIPVPLSTLKYRQKRKAQMNVSDEESSIESSNENREVEDTTAALQNVERQEMSLSENTSIPIESDNSSIPSDDRSYISSDDDVDNNEFYNEDPYDNSSEDENENDEGNTDNLPLFDGVNICRNEADIIIMAYCLRHNLTDIALQNQLQLRDCFLPENVFKSKHRFLKAFPPFKCNEYYYCEGCSVVLKNDEFKNLSCTSCNSIYNQKFLKEQGKYFTYIPLTPQLENFVKSKAYLHLHQFSENESDIIHGNVYKQLRENNLIEPTTLTLTCNTDGVSLSKSSKLCMWPIFASINELPYRIRRNNMILCGLYVGYDKPDMNMYLEPLTEELKVLCDTGFICSTYSHKEPISIKVYTLICSVDSVARASIQNVKQFNGKYGCSYCYHEGERVEVGSGFARIYSYDENVQERCSETHETAVQEATETGEIMKGVKGPSVMSMIPFLDIINGYPPEYMHSCIIGVGKLFGLEWFDSKNSDEVWYLGLLSKELNDKLINIKPPCEVTRTPQPITTSKYKANDWKYFILYYSLPCLHDLMPTVYFKHWSLFVYALSIFLKSHISNIEFNLASSALKQFVSEIEKLYGKRFMKYNVHLLTHIPKFVKYYGALWAWSAFPYEHYNGVILKLFHGTQYIQEQICKLYHRIMYIKRESYIFDKDDANEQAKRFFIKVMNQCKVKNCIEYGEHLRVFGKSQSISLSVVQKIITENCLNESISNIAFPIQRFIYKNILFHSCEYNKLIKRNNSTVLMDNGDIVIIKDILKVELNSGEHRYVILGKKMEILNEKLFSNNIYDAEAFSYVMRETTVNVCHKVISIVKKCVLVPFQDNKFCVFPIGNKVEPD